MSDQAQCIADLLDMVLTRNANEAKAGPFMAFYSDLSRTVGICWDNERHRVDVANVGRDVRSGELFIMESGSPWLANQLGADLGTIGSILNGGADQWGQTLHEGLRLFRSKHTPHLQMEEAALHEWADHPGPGVLPG